MASASASALTNSLAVACLLALVVAAGAARQPAPAPAPEPEPGMMRPCHSNNGWSGHLCKDVCKASGFSAYDFTLPNAVTGTVARCCCCPKDDHHACLEA